MSEIVCLCPVLEVLVVRDHCELQESFKIVTPVFECPDDGHEFLVIDLIVALGCVHHF